MKTLFERAIGDDQINLIEWAKRKGSHFEEAIHLTTLELERRITHAKNRDAQDAQICILVLIKDDTLPCFRGTHNEYND